MHLHMRNKITALAIRKAGGIKRVAKALCITYQAVQCWPKVPAKHVLFLESMSGVSRHNLRPDIFGPPPQLQPLQVLTSESIPFVQGDVARDLKIEM